jgi:hypothetical protein
VNSGATIFDDRETVEFLRDRPHLLAIADAVRATQRERTRSALRRKPLLIAAAAALVACATAAALIAVFAVPGTSSHHTAVGSGPPEHPIITVNGGTPGNAPGLVPLNKALSSASKSFGVPIILPNTPVLKPSEAGATANEQWLPSPKPGVQEPVSQLTVQFPSPFVSITYAPTALTYWGSHYPDALDQYRAEIAQAMTPSDYQIVSLSDGTPALIGVGKTGNSFWFRLGKLSIIIWAPNNNGIPTTVDASALQGLAQSMVDQAATANP